MELTVEKSFAEYQMFMYVVLLPLKHFSLILWIVTSCRWSAMHDMTLTAIAESSLMCHFTLICDLGPLLLRSRPKNLWLSLWNTKYLAITGAIITFLDILRFDVAKARVELNPTTSCLPQSHHFPLATIPPPPTRHNPTTSHSPQCEFSNHWATVTGGFFTISNIR